MERGKERKGIRRIIKKWYFGESTFLNTPRKLSPTM